MNKFLLSGSWLDDILTSTMNEIPQTQFEGNPLVSILVTSYNYEQYLRKCIDSALNQSYSRVEIVVVDDGSTDSSKEIIASYGKRIIPIHQNNKGTAAAFNAAFSASHGEVICRLDSDDYFFPEKVARAVDIFQSYPQIAWFFHQLRIVDRNGKQLKETRLKRTGKLDLREHIIKTGLMPIGNTCGSGLCFSRSLLQKMYPLPDNSKLSVTERYLKAVACATAEGFFDGQPLAALRIHGRNIFSGSQNKKKLSKIVHITISNAYWLRKNWPILRRYSNKTLGQGLGISKRIGAIDQNHINLLNEYLSSAAFQDRLEVKLFSLYYRYFWRLR